MPQPVRQLVGYTSVQVPAGRTVRVSFPLNDRSFASWSSTGWQVLPGCYRLAAGSYSRDLPSTGVIGRGARCAGEGAQLGTGGSSFLPLPPTASAVMVGRRRERAR
jgi:beta-glucosidase